MKVAKPPSIRVVFQRAKEFARERIDESVVKPRSTLQTISFILYQLVFIVFALWLTWWLPQVDIESARWALSAQAQASGVILGLLVAAMIFRWSIISNEEQELQNKIHLYFKQLAVPSAEVKQYGLNRFIVDVAYDEYLSCINQEKGKVQKKMGKALRTLGRFWVINRLSLSYSIAVDMALSRNLRRGEIRDLSRASKVSKNSAINMWESYFTNPARFILAMHDAIQYVSRMLAIHRRYGKRTAIRQAIREREIPLSLSTVKEYQILEEVVGLMRSDDTWLRASRIARWRSAIRPLFYISCGLLFTATILAITILTGFGGFESLLVQEPTIFLYLVGVPIGLAIFGAYTCIMIIFFVLQ